ncbi:uncharacterized protein CMU_003610 [Cryptosporidium muris RN66]|uniref:Macro domain-containing protein n=1 Tax=Cryptosporidium muris (strain RN66) TaxID=441375 RepID=B6AJY1_CRYMR|nr:uncharacterized protein CMU_003610 [Cryptosporidium muris RN66]EEA08522.1 hypothetical protein, conserved [Cryptosporidium muris RN66]|eukprot:XP_002142871.1 hypothetical protein [Cryptosporidium muris RN66]
MIIKKLSHISIILLSLCFLIVESVIRCPDIRPLSYYLSSRGGGIRVTECVGIVLADCENELSDGIYSCDAVVVDTSTRSSQSLLRYLGMTCPANIGQGVHVSHVASRNRDWLSTSKHIFCVASSSTNLESVYRNIFETGMSYSEKEVLLPILSISTGNPELRAREAAIHTRTWLRNRYDVQSGCPLRIIFTESSPDLYNIALEEFSKAFSKNPFALQSINTQPTQFVPPPPVSNTQQPQQLLPSVPLLRDLNQYENLACPTIKNLYDLLLSLGEPNIVHVTSSATQVSIVKWDIPPGPYACDAIVLDVDSSVAHQTCDELGYNLNTAPVTGEIAFESFNFPSTPLMWFTSIRKLYTLSYLDLKSYYGGGDILKEALINAYMAIFDHAKNNNIVELLIVPFGFDVEEDRGSSLNSALCLKALGESLQLFLSSSYNLHVVLISNYHNRVKTMTEVIKLYFMSNNNFIQNRSIQTNNLPKRSPQPIARRSMPLQPNRSDTCGSNHPLSELIFNFYGKSAHSPSKYVSFLNNSIPGILSCECIVIDVAKPDHVKLLANFGSIISSCKKVGSSELKVLSNNNTMRRNRPLWSHSIRRIFCVNTHSLIYTNKKENTNALYRKILNSAKNRCSSIIMPLLSVSSGDSKYSMRQYISEAASAMSSFYSNNRNMALQTTIYEENDEIFQIGLDLFAEHFTQTRSQPLSSLITNSVRNLPYNKLNYPTSTPYPEARLSNRRLNKPPQRPLLPKFKYNSYSNRPAPQRATNVNISSTSSRRSNLDCKLLMSLKDVIYNLHDFVPKNLSSRADQIYFVNTEIPPGPKNCDVLVLDINSDIFDFMIQQTNQELPSLLPTVTVLANMNYGSGSGDIIDTLNRLYIIDTSLVTKGYSYTDIIETAIRNQERDILLPMFNLKEKLMSSRSVAKNYVVEVINIILGVLDLYDSSLKVIFYESDYPAALLLQSILINVLSGTSIVTT